MTGTNLQVSSKGVLFAALVVLTAATGCGRRHTLGELRPSPSDDGAPRDAANEGPETPADADAGPTGDGGVDGDGGDANVTGDANDARDATPADVVEAGEGGCIATAGNGHEAWPSPQFGAPKMAPLPGGGSAQSVAIGDVTGDGRADVVVGVPDANLVVVYAQTVGGELAAPRSYLASIGGSPALAELELADANGDGRLDVIYTIESGIGLMLQDAAGSLQPPRTLAAATLGSGAAPVALAVGDLNGDGRADVAAVGGITEGIDVWFQSAAGTLGAAQTFVCPHQGYESLVAGDIDGDGLADLAVSGQQQKDVCILVQTKTGFAPAISVPLNVSVQGLGIGSFGPGTCAPEVVFSTGGNSPDGALYLVPSPTQAGAHPSLPLRSHDIPESLVVADVDGDGRSDVVVIHTGWLTVGVYRQLPEGGLGAEEKYEFPYVNWGTDRIAVGDINGDGRADVVGVDSTVAVLYHR